jgi:hypothetical protein
LVMTNKEEISKDALLKDASEDLHALAYVTRVHGDTIEAMCPAETTFDKDKRVNVFAFSSIEILVKEMGTLWKG